LKLSSTFLNPPLTTHHVRPKRSRLIVKASFQKLKEETYQLKRKGLIGQAQTFIAQQA
jgi:hypothetical protein